MREISFMFVVVLSLFSSALSQSEYKLYRLDSAASCSGYMTPVSLDTAPPTNADLIQPGDEFSLSLAAANRKSHWVERFSAAEYSTAIQVRSIQGALTQEIKPHLIAAFTPKAGAGFSIENRVIHGPSIVDSGSALEFDLSIVADRTINSSVVDKAGSILGKFNVPYVGDVVQVVDLATAMFGADGQVNIRVSGVVPYVTRGITAGYVSGPYIAAPPNAKIQNLVVSASGTVLTSSCTKIQSGNIPDFILFDLKREPYQPGVELRARNDAAAHISDSNTQSIDIKAAIAKNEDYVFKKLIYTRFLILRNVSPAKTLPHVSNFITDIVQTDFQQPTTFADFADLLPTWLSIEGDDRFLPSQVPTLPKILKSRLNDMKIDSSQPTQTILSLANTQLAQKTITDPTDDQQLVSFVSAYQPFFRTVEGIDIYTESDSLNLKKLILTHFKMDDGVSLASPFDIFVSAMRNYSLAEASELYFDFALKRVRKGSACDASLVKLRSWITVKKPIASCGLDEVQTRFLQVSNCLASEPSSENAITALRDWTDLSLGKADEWVAWAGALDAGLCYDGAESKPFYVDTAARQALKVAKQKNLEFLNRSELPDDASDQLFGPLIDAVNSSSSSPVDREAVRRWINSVARIPADPFGSDNGWIDSLDLVNGKWIIPEGARPHLSRYLTLLQLDVQNHTLTPERFRSAALNFAQYGLKFLSSSDRLNYEQQLISALDSDSQIVASKYFGYPTPGDLLRDTQHLPVVEWNKLVKDYDIKIISTADATQTATSQSLPTVQLTRKVG